MKVNSVTQHNIKDVITEVFKGSEKSKLLEFVDFLKSNDMEFERGTGYWENQLYFMVKYHNEYVCFILINGTGDESDLAPLTIWSDDSGSKWYENYPIKVHQKEIAWSNVDFCVSCGACGGGICKNIFGRTFNNVCRTTMRFVNPDEKTLEFIKRIVEIRKNDIIILESNK